MKIKKKMKIFISSSLFPNRTVISDEMNEYKINIDEPIQLLFVDGSTTISIFKRLYLAGMDAFFVVRNIEFFMFKMRQFKGMKYEIVENDDRTGEYSELLKEKDKVSVKLAKMVKKYISIENKLRNAINKGALNKCVNNKAIINKTTINEDSINKDVDEMKKGVLVSFRPKILDSIRSSLENSRLYLSEDSNCHLIFKRLKEKKCSIEEIENISEDKESIHKTLKSMIFTGIVIKKGEILSLNDLIS